MYPRYRRKQQNPVEKAMRPGVLLMALLIGFAIVFLFTPAPSRSPVAAEGAGEDHASFEEPKVNDSKTDLETAKEEDSRIDDAVEEDRTPYEGGDAGEGYEDEGQPRPGDNETDDETDGAPPPATEEDEEAGDDESAADDKRHRECIYVPGIDGFHVIDDKHLTVSTSPRRIYLVTLWNRCFGLKWSHQIAIKSYSSWTCSHSRDTIISEDNRCIIDDIERVESNEAAARIVADRTGSDD